MKPNKSHQKTSLSVQLTLGKDEPWMRQLVNLEICLS